MSDSRTRLHTALGLLVVMGTWAMPAALADRDSAQDGAAGMDMRDPLRPPGMRAGPVPEFDASRWTLSSTLVAQGRRVAIINGRVVGPGDTVDGARILGVEAGNVVLRVGAHRFTIRSSTPRVRTSIPRESTP